MSDCSMELASIEQSLLPKSLYSFLSHPFGGNMLSKHCMVILRILIGATLCWHTIPRAEAKEIDVVHEAPICQEAQVSNKEDVTPSAKKMRKVAKSHQISEGKDTSGLEENSCQTSETTQTENTDEPVNSPDTYDGDSNPVDEPANSFPDGGGNQDAPNLNFSINLNIGEGSSPDSGVSFPNESPSPSSEPETSSPIPSQSLPDGETNPASESPSPQPKKPHKPKHKKDEQNKPKKPNKDNKDPKRDRPKHSKEESLKPDKHTNRDKGQSHENHLKDHRKPRIRDKSFIDKLPPSHRLPNTPKQKQKAHPNRRHTTHRRQINQPNRQNITSPVRFQPNLLKRAPYSLRNRSQPRPLFQQHKRLHKVIRHSTPRHPRIHRRIGQ
jgi:hypothetical protein